MGGNEQRKFLEFLIEGLEAHGVSVTPEMRETLEERLMSLMATTTQGKKRRNMNKANKPAFTSGYLDLVDGVFHATEGGPVIERLTRWPDRERILANSLCLAEATGASSLSICDLTVLWPDWLRVADRLSDLMTLWYPSRWQIEKAVNRFGYTVKRVEEFAWGIFPDADANTTVILSAKVAAADIRDAGVAFTNKDYTAAAQHCIKALDRCPMAHAAHLLIAELSRQRHCGIDMERQMQSAEALLDRQRNVQHTLNRMKTLRKTARSNGHRECVTESIEQLENEIAAITPQCVWAQQTLEENMEADNDGE